MNVSDIEYYLSKGFLYLEEHRAEPQTLIASSEDSLQHSEKTKDWVGLGKGFRYNRTYEEVGANIIKNETIHIFGIGFCVPQINRIMRT